MNLSGKHVVVTGAGRRIGRALAEAVLSAGANLTAHYRTAEGPAKELDPLAKKLGRKIAFISADLKVVKEIQTAVAQAEKTLGPVDVLINSASLFYPTPALECTEAQWDELLDTNLKGQFFFAQACGPSLKKQKGAIINIADVQAETPLSRYTPYTASKAGLVMMTRNLAKEWAPEVRVNSVSPGAVLLPETYTEEQKQKSIAKTPLARVGSPADIVAAVLFLLGNDYITGFDLRVDGGRCLL